MLLEFIKKREGRLEHFYLYQGLARLFHLNGYLSPDVTRIQNDTFLMYPLLSLRQLLNYSVALSGRTKDQAVASDTVSKAKMTQVFLVLFKTMMPIKKVFISIREVME